MLWAVQALGVDVYGKQTQAVFRLNCEAEFVGLFPNRICRQRRFHFLLS